MTSIVEEGMYSNNRSNISDVLDKGSSFPI